MGDKQKLSAEESQKYLLVLLNLPENKECADCLAKGPRWASANIGVFLCINCSGIHRSIGVHISQVRSVSLDKWTPEQLETMKRVGNGRAAEIYEATLPENHRRPSGTESYALEQFIREKYERKLYFKKNNSNNNTGNSSSNGRNHNSTPSKVKPVVTPIANKAPVAELIQWESDTSNVPSNSGFDGFTAFTGTNIVHEDVEFSGFQSANTNTNNIMNSPRNNVTSNVDAENAFFGVSSNNNVTNNGPKPTQNKDSILQLYNQPIISGGINSNSSGIYSNTTNTQQHQANYNVRMPSLGLGTGGVHHPHHHPHTHPIHHPTISATPVNNMYNSSNGYSNNMYSTTSSNGPAPPGYINPIAANMLLNNNMNNTMNMNMGMNGPTMIPSNYINPNYLKMMGGPQQQQQQRW